MPLVLLILFFSKKELLSSVCKVHSLYYYDRFTLSVNEEIQEASMKDFQNIKYKIQKKTKINKLIYLNIHHNQEGKKRRQFYLLNYFYLSNIQN